MTIEYVSGDITKAENGLIIHGVNCQRVMGSGLALHIKNKWPEVYNEYMKQGQGKDMLGQTSIIMVDDKLFVANCYTQVNYGRKEGHKYANIDAIDKCLESAFIFCSSEELTLHVPKIGCGLGGLDWDNEVFPLVYKKSLIYPDVKIIIYTF